MPRRPRLLPVTAAVAGALLLAACGSSAPPEVTAYAAGKALVVAPTLYCPLDLDQARCTVGTTSELAVPAGTPLQLSLPGEIAEAPWRLIAVYRTADGQERQDDQVFRPDERLAVTVAPQDPAEQLLGVEIQLPSSVIDEQGAPIARATWGIATDPATLGQG